MKRLVRLVVPLMLLLSLAPVTVRAAPSFTASGSVNPATVASAQPVTISLAIKNTSRSRTTATVVATLYRPNGSTAATFAGGP